MEISGDRMADEEVAEALAVVWQCTIGLMFTIVTLSKQLQECTSSIDYATRKLSGGPR